MTGRGFKQTNPVLGHPQPLADFFLDHCHLFLYNLNGRSTKTELTSVGVIRWYRLQGF